jgi:hypothetical protein
MQSLAWFSFSDYKILHKNSKHINPNKLKLPLCVLTFFHYPSLPHFKSQWAQICDPYIPDFLVGWISSYNLLRNNNKFNCNTKSYYNTNKNVFLKHLATKTIESKKITLLLYYTKYWLTRTIILHYRILSQNELKFVTQIFQIFRWVDSNLIYRLYNVRWAVNINYWWIPYVQNCERGWAVNINYWCTLYF